MPVRQYANAPATTLANSCTSLATSIVVTAVTGLPISYPYTLILERGTASEEAVSVTAAAGTTLTVTRGIDGTTAFAHSAGASVAHGITAQDIREANAHVNATQDVHGVTGLIMPPGVILEYGGSAAPAGWLMADGTAVSRTTYAALFAAIGTTYGAGDGSTTFNLPNRKGRVAVGRDAAQTEFDTLGETGGAKTHTLTTAEMPSHTHTQNAHNHTQASHNHGGSVGTTDPSDYDYGAVPTAFYDSTNWAVFDQLGGGYHQRVMVWVNGGAGLSHSHTISSATPTIDNTTATNQNTGGDGAHNNLQPYIVLNHIIKI